MNGAVLLSSSYVFLACTGKLYLLPLAKNDLIFSVILEKQ